MSSGYEEVPSAQPRAHGQPEGSEASSVKVAGDQTSPQAQAHANKSHTPGHPSPHEDEAVLFLESDTSQDVASSSQQSPNARTAFSHLVIVPNPSEAAGEPRAAESQQEAGNDVLRKTSLLVSWRLELLAAICIPLSLAATVLTLALHQSKALPEWPFNISVNALASVFALILKAVMFQILAEG